MSGTAVQPLTNMVDQTNDTKVEMESAIITNNNNDDEYDDDVFKESVVTNVNNNAASLPPLFAVTMATEVRGYLPQLEESARRLGINLKVLGMGRPFGGYVARLLDYARYLETAAPPGAICLAVDGYDTVFLAPEAEIRRKFVASGHRVLYSAEAEPVQLLHNIGYRTHFDVGTLPGISPDTHRRYLNAGMCMGYRDDLIKLQRAVAARGGGGAAPCDQILTIRHWRENPTQLTIDTQCSIFINSWPNVSVWGTTTGEVDLEKEGLEVVRCGDDEVVKDSGEVVKGSGEEVKSSGEVVKDSGEVVKGSGEVVKGDDDDGEAVKCNGDNHEVVRVREIRSGNFPCVFQSPGKGSFNGLLVQLGYDPSPVDKSFIDFTLFRLHKVNVLLRVLVRRFTNRIVHYITSSEGDNVDE